MFQKENSSIGSKNDVPLGKKDKKKLRDVATQQFSSDASAQIDKIFMEGSISVRKVQHEKLGKVQLYYKSPNADDGGDTHAAFWPYSTTTQCIWMSIDVGPNQFLHAPTVALLSVIPHVPTVVIPYQVSKFICRGAHLMRAGIHQGCLPLPPDHNHSPSMIVAVRVHGNPQPFAVGQVTANTNANTVGPGTQGVGVEIWTSYGDDLWRTTNSHPPKSLVGLVINEQGGAPFDNGNYGNVGFLEGKMVRPIMTIDDDEHDYDDNDDNEEDNQTGNVARTMLAHGTNPSSGIQDNGQLPTEGNEDHNVANGDAPLISVESLEVSDLNDSTASQPKVDTSCEGDAHDTVDDNDENPEDVLLHQAVCKALVNLKDKELPMATSIFYANHVLPSRPPDTSIELKRTSWKKFGPYLLEMQREELLVLSADKDKNPAGFIKSVNRQHLDLRGIKKEIMVDPNGTKSKLSIVTLYIIPNHFVDLMGLNIDDVKAANAKSEDRRGTGFLTQPRSEDHVGPTT
jgi:translation initiation factor 2D